MERDVLGHKREKEAREREGERGKERERERERGRERELQKREIISSPTPPAMRLAEEAVKVN